MLVVRTGKEIDPHWCDSAENVICAFIAYICALEGNPAARNLRGRAGTDRLAGELCQCSGGDAAADRLLRRAAAAVALADLACRQGTWLASCRMPAVHQHFRCSAGGRKHRLDQLRPDEAAHRQDDDLYDYPSRQDGGLGGPAKALAGMPAADHHAGHADREKPRAVPGGRMCPYRPNAGVGRRHDADRGHGYQDMVVFPVDRTAQEMLRRQRRDGARQPGNATVFLDQFLRNRRGDVQAIGDETIVIRTEGDNQGTSPMGGDGKSPAAATAAGRRTYRRSPDGCSSPRKS